MNNDENNNINYNVANIGDDFKIGTVGEYLELLLSLETKQEKNHEDIKHATSILDSLVSDLLNRPATNFNLSVLLLSLHKKDKQISSFYTELVSKYSSTANNIRVNHQNVFSLVEDLLHEANLIVNPQNEIDKYFNGANYAFAVGIKVEEFYKYIPDQSLQDLIQDTMRRRVSFLMTLLQMRTDRFGVLKDIYLNNSVYSREIALCILFHTLRASLDGSQKTIIELYNEVKKNVYEDIRTGKVQLPDKRIFELKSRTKKILLQKEFKEIFLNEKDFEKNNILRILSSFTENFEKIKTQIFPVVAVRDPISGKIIKVTLTKYGPKIEEMDEVSIPKLSVISEEIEDYVRKELAKSIANNPNVNLENAVKDVLKTKHLDSETTVKTIVDMIRPSIYENLGWNRKLLFWMNNFDSEKTVIGNLATNLISQTLLPSQFKNILEKYTNIKGTTITALALGLGLGGIPAAIVLGAGAAGVAKLIKPEINEITFSKSFLNNVYGYTKKDLNVLSINGTNPYLELLKFIANNDSEENFLKEYKKIFKTADGYKVNERSSSYQSPFASGFASGFASRLAQIPVIGILFKRKYLNNTSSVNIAGVQAAKNIQYSANFLVSLIGAIGLKIGISTNRTSSILRRSKENIEFIKNLSIGTVNVIKRKEALDILNLVAKKSAVFGYNKAILATLMLKQLTQSAPKQRTHINLGIFFTPNYQKAPGENFLYSWTGRTLQKTAYAIGQNLRLLARRNGANFTENIITSVGVTSGRISSGFTSQSNFNLLNKSTAGFVFLAGSIFGIIFFSIYNLSPLILANQVAFLGGTGGGDSTPISQEILCPNGVCPISDPNQIGVCPIKGPIYCTQSSYTNGSHANLNATDLDDGKGQTYATKVYAVVDGEIQIGEVACDGKEIVLLKGIDGIVYKFLHTMNPLPTRSKVTKGITVIAELNTAPPIGCTTAKHLHVEVIGVDPITKKSVAYNPLLREIGVWKCDLEISKKTYGSYCQGGDYLKQP